MRAEIAQATKENKNFVRNVERAKMIENIQRKKAARKISNESVQSSLGDDSQVQMRRTFRQRPTENASKIKTGKSESYEKVQKVLSKVFG